jgi:hypothetical protein
MEKSPASSVSMYEPDSINKRGYLPMLCLLLIMLLGELCALQDEVAELRKSTTSRGVTAPTPVKPARQVGQPKLMLRCGWSY